MSGADKFKADVIRIVQLYLRDSEQTDAACDISHSPETKVGFLFSSKHMVNSAVCAFYSIAGALIAAHEIFPKFPTHITLAAQIYPIFGGIAVAGLLAGSEAVWWALGLSWLVEAYFLLPPEGFGIDAELIPFCLGEGAVTILVAAAAAASRPRTPGARYRPYLSTLRTNLSRRRIVHSSSVIGVPFFCRHNNT